MPLTTHVHRARTRIRSSRPILLLVLVSLAVVLGPSMAPAAQLDLNWADNSDGQASFIIQRSADANLRSGQYTRIAQVPIGVTSYSDTTVALGTTYCYQVAAVDSKGVSSFSKVACAKPGGSFSISVTKTGAAGGTIVSSPPGITCGTTCMYSYPAGKVVTLTATPPPGSTFTGWARGGCSGTGPCTMVGNVSVTVTATFDSTPVQILPVSKPRSGADSQMSVGSGSNKDGRK